MVPYNPYIGKDPKQYCCACLKKRETKGNLCFSCLYAAYKHLLLEREKNGKD